MTVIWCIQIWFIGKHLPSTVGCCEARSDARLLQLPCLTADIFPQQAIVQLISPDKLLVLLPAHNNVALISAERKQGHFQEERQNHFQRKDLDLDYCDFNFTIWIGPTIKGFHETIHVFIYQLIESCLQDYIGRIKQNKYIKLWVSHRGTRIERCKSGFGLALKDRGGFKCHQTSQEKTHPVCNLSLSSSVFSLHKQKVQTLTYCLNIRS